MNRIIYFVLVSFMISLLLGPIVIPVLKRLKFGQSIREDGPQSHLKKAGTPTMGGIIFIVACIISILLSGISFKDEGMVALYSMMAFGFIGLLDDGLKIARKHNEGLKPGQKMILLLAFSLIFAFYGKNNPYIGTKILVPFTSKYWDLGIWYVPFIIIFFAATTNAVNLTDGLDGLATSITILVTTFFAIVSFVFSGYHITLSIYCGVLVGALLGFLRYNAYPARIFMGDTGSLALGGAVAATAMILKMPLFIIIVGGIYLLEALSVIIQVASFKLTGKRVFKMAPIHHHFEKSGWHEAKIVAVFSIITVILCLIAFISLPVIK